MLDVRGTSTARKCSSQLVLRSQGWNKVFTTCMDHLDLRLSCTRMSTTFCLRSSTFTNEAAAHECSPTQGLLAVLQWARRLQLPANPNAFCAHTFCQNNSVALTWAICVKSTCAVQHCNDGRADTSKISKSHITDLHVFARRPDIQILCTPVCMLRSSQWLDLRMRPNICEWTCSHLCRWRRLGFASSPVQLKYSTHIVAPL